MQARSVSPVDKRPWTSSVTPIAPHAATVPHTSNLLYAGIVTGAWSGVLSLLVYLIGRLFGVTFAVVGPTDSVPTPLPWLLMLLAPLAAAIVGALLAAIVLGRRHTRRIVFWGGTVLAVASCWSPLAQPEGVTWPTKILLILCHVITWFLVVPQIARIAGDSQPDAYEARQPGEPI